MEGHRRDEQDAQLIREVATALRGWQETGGRPAPTKVLREAVWFFWQSPRLERPLVNGKYPRGAMWSREAAELVLGGADAARGQLVIEHIEPMHRLLRQLIDAPHETSDIAALLRSRLTVVVVTRAESDALPDLGVPDQRYRVAGLDVDDFRSLDDWKNVLDDHVRRPAELAQVAPGQAVWDLMGREWLVVDVMEDGMRLADQEDSESFFTWHGLLTLGASGEPPATT